MNGLALISTGCLKKFLFSFQSFLLSLPPTYTFINPLIVASPNIQPLLIVCLRFYWWTVFIHWKVWWWSNSYEPLQVLFLPLAEWKCTYAFLEKASSFILSHFSDKKINCFESNYFSLQSWLYCHHSHSLNGNFRMMTPELVNFLNFSNSFPQHTENERTSTALCISAHI